MADTETHDDILDLIAPLRRYVGARIRSHQDRDDVVQETLTRVIAAAPRLDQGVSIAYAIVVARRLMVDQAAQSARERRQAHRVLDLTQPDRPEDAVLLAEERIALRDALSGIDPERREALLAQVLGDEPVTGMAADAGVSSGSVAAQLARTRARLRVDYVVALRGVKLPTQRCMPVLLALSASDTRRQQVLRAGQHLLTCTTCSSISEPLLRRRSVLAAVLPWLGLGPLLGLLRRLVRQSPAQATAAGVGATLATAALIAAVHSAGPSSAPTPSAVAGPVTSSRPASTPGPTPSRSSPTAVPRGQIVRTSDGAALLPAPVDLTSRVGERVRGTAVPVLSVPADEGFWIGDAGQGRIWIQLTRVGGESPARIRRNDTVTFTGVVTRNGAGFARQVGVGASEDAALLTRQGAHLTVEESNLKVSSP